MTTERTAASAVHRNAVAILRAASVRRVGERRWGSGGHLASYVPKRRSSTGWDTFSWTEPERVCRVDMARHRTIARAQARTIIERNTQ